MTQKVPTTQIEATGSPSTSNYLRGDGQWEQLDHNDISDFNTEVDARITAANLVSEASSAVDNAIVRFNGTTGALIQNSGVEISDANDLHLTTTASGSLGTASLQWSSLFLSSTSAINFANGDVTVTHATNALAFAGASNGYVFDAAILPDASNTIALGSTTAQFADLFLGDGAVINFDNGDITLTNSNNELNFEGGTFDMNNNQIRRPEIRDYSVTHTTASSSAGSITFNHATANSFQVALTENITAITLNNPPSSGNYGEIVIEFTQDTTARTVAGWPAGVLWAGGVAYTASTASGAIDKVVLSTRDGGTTWLGDYSTGYA